jgi:hypothetical protein
MNRPLPPGNRGHRAPDPGRASGSARAVPGIGGLVGGTAAADRQEAVGTGAGAPVDASGAKGGPAVPTGCGGRNVGQLWRDTGLRRAVGPVAESGREWQGFLKKSGLNSSEPFWPC